MNGIIRKITITEELTLDGKRKILGIELACFGSEGQTVSNEDAENIVRSYGCDLDHYQQACGHPNRADLWTWFEGWGREPRSHENLPQSIEH